MSHFVVKDDVSHYRDCVGYEQFCVILQAPDLIQEISCTLVNADCEGVAAQTAIAVIHDMAQFTNRVCLYWIALPDVLFKAVSKRVEIDAGPANQIWEVFTLLRLDAPRCDVKVAQHVVG